MAEHSVEVELVAARRRANITETLITWTERGAELGARWTINRLTGAWRMVTAGSAAYGGQCTAPPPRKF